MGKINDKTNDTAEKTMVITGTVGYDIRLPRFIISHNTLYTFLVKNSSVFGKFINFTVFF
jgi:hypothetical protein